MDDVKKYFGGKTPTALLCEYALRAEYAPTYEWKEAFTPGRSYPVVDSAYNGDALIVLDNFDSTWIMFPTGFLKNFRAI